MALTRQNMRTDPTGGRDDITSLLSDIGQMDDPQLETYLRLAFTGQIDADFLPPHSHFWRGHSVNGGDGLHGGPLPVGAYFGGQIYHLLYDAAIGFSKLRAPTNIQTPLRFLNILERFLRECIDYKGTPDERQLIMAQSAIDTIGYIRFNERPDLGINYPSEHRTIFTLAKEIQRDPRYRSLSFSSVRA